MGRWALGESHTVIFMMEKSERILKKTEEIEVEMKKIGFWSVDQIHIDPIECKEAFCGDKIPFEQWLQFVFIPAVKKSVSTNEFPQESMVGVKATREYDYMTATPPGTRTGHLAK
jgi:uncharacterized protein YqcC (DUF446 family)